MSDEIKVGITENDIKEAMSRNATLDELVALTDKYMFEQLKAKQAKDAEFEIIEPKQIENKSFDENVKDFMNVGDDLKEAVYHAHDIEIYNLLKDIVEPKLLTDKPKQSNQLKPK